MGTTSNSNGLFSSLHPGDEEPNLSHCRRLCRCSFMQITQGPVGERLLEGAWHTWRQQSVWGPSPGEPPDRAPQPCSGAVLGERRWRRAVDWRSLLAPLGELSPRSVGVRHEGRDWPAGKSAHPRKAISSRCYGVASPRSIGASAHPVVWPLTASGCANSSPMLFVRRHMSAKDPNEGSCPQNASVHLTHLFAISPMHCQRDGERRCDISHSAETRGRSLPYRTVNSGDTWQYDRH